MCTGARSSLRIFIVSASTWPRSPPHTQFPRTTRGTPYTGCVFAADDNAGSRGTCRQTSGTRFFTCKRVSVIFVFSYTSTRVDGRKRRRETGRNDRSGSYTPTRRRVVEYSGVSRYFFRYYFIFRLLFCSIECFQRRFSISRKRCKRRVRSVERRSSTRFARRSTKSRSGRNNDV